MCATSDEPLRHLATLCALGVLLSTTIVGCAAAAGRGVEGGDGAWRLDPLWDDGRAELCVYRVSWPRYGATRTGRALLVLVKEPWRPDLDVKADRPVPDGFDVLKLNHVRDARTGIYEYHQMASVFLEREGGETVKMTTTSSEACGITTAELVDGRLTTHSYFDGQGESRKPYPGGLPQDGLPALLREWVAGEVPSEIAVFPSLLVPRLPELVPHRWRLARRQVEYAAPDGEPDGEPVPAVELRLERDGAWQSYVFARDVPHRMLEHSTGDGTHYRLARCERLAYWELNRPGDEEWLPPDLR